MKYKYIFGPVASRRLGVSLGLDLIPYKTCSFDCIFCECGATTNKTFKRKVYVSFNKIKKEIDSYLYKEPKLDYITLGGSGEPTLNKDIGKIINYLKKTYPQYKIAVLTNSSLLFNKQVQNDLKNADLVLPSLHAISKDIFEKICRMGEKEVYKKITKIINGLIDFSKNFKGQIWLEVFIVPSINDTKDELNKLKEIVSKIRLDRVQLNTLDRPGTESNIESISYEKLNQIKEDFFKNFIIDIVKRER